MNTYSNPLTCTYMLPAAALDAAARLATLPGPAGMKGRLRSIAVSLTADLTVASSTVTVGTAADPDAAGTLVVEVASAGAIDNNASLVNDFEFAADTAFVIDTGGEATAGDGNVVVVIDWYE